MREIAQLIAAEGWHRVTEDCWSKMTLVAVLYTAWRVNRRKPTDAQAAATV